MCKCKNENKFFGKILLMCLKSRFWKFHMTKLCSSIMRNNSIVKYAAIYSVFIVTVYYVVFLSFETFVRFYFDVDLLMEIICERNFGFLIIFLLGWDDCKDWYWRSERDEGLFSIQFNNVRMYWTILTSIFICMKGKQYLNIKP